MRLVAPWSKVVCPFCFARFHPSDVARRLLSPNAPTEPDHALGKHLTIPPPLLAKVHDPPSVKMWQQILRQFIVHHDSTGEWKGVCPKCHISLPSKTINGELSNEVFALIGAKSSGKSNFFGVLLKQLVVRQYSIY